MKKPKLTLRQKKFVEAYLECGNAAKAAVAAGFKPSYAQGAMRQTAVREYLIQHRETAIPKAEVVDFLLAVMRNEIDASKLRTKAAIQLGIRAGLWRGETAANLYIEEASKHE